MRLPKHGQLLGLKTEQTWEMEEQIIGVAEELHIGVKAEMLIEIEIEAEANLMNKPVEQAYGGGARERRICQMISIGKLE